MPVDPKSAWEVAKGAYDLYVFLQPKEERPPSLDKILSGVRSVFREELRDEALRETGAHLNSLQQQYNHYLNAPSGVDRLHAATQAASDLVADLETLGTKGHQLWSTAIGLQLNILAQRAKLDDNEVKNIIEVCKHSVRYHYGYNIYDSSEQFWHPDTIPMFTQWSSYFDKLYKNSHGGWPPDNSEVTYKQAEEIVYPINEIVIGFGLEAIYREELCRKIDKSGLKHYTISINPQSASTFVSSPEPIPLGTPYSAANRFVIVRDEIRRSDEWKHACGR